MLINTNYFSYGIQSFYSSIIMTFFSILLFVACVISTLCSRSACYGYNSNDRIQSGIVIFEKNTSITCHEIDIEFPIPSSGFEVTVSTSDLYQYKPDSGLDYYVRAEPKENDPKVLVLTLVVEDNSWKKIAISYLASSNPALYLGSFTIDTFSLFRSEDKKFNSEIVSHYVEVNKKYADYEIALFISGVKTNDSTIFLKLENPTYDPKTSWIEFTLKVSSKPSLENIHLSYVIWQKSSISIDLFDVQEVSKADYQLIGVDKFKKSIAQYKGLGIEFDRLFCVGQRCRKSCISTDECKKWNGIIEKDICYICGRYEKFHKGKCVPDCQQNEIFIDRKCECKEGYIRFGNDCKFTCGINEIWQGGCICAPGHGKIDGVCRQCPPYSQVSSDKKSCICEQDYYWNSINKTCDYLVCPSYSKVVWDEGYSCECEKEYQKEGDKCIKICGPYRVWNQDECVCSDGYIDVKGICKQCPVHSSPSSDKTSCVCKQDYYWNSPTWKCDYLTCGENSKPVYKTDQYICQCNIGYEYHYGRCQPQIQCPPRSTWNPNRLTCECTHPSEHLIKNQCQQCVQHEGWNGKKCVCQTGYFKIKGVCRTCDLNTFYNGRDCICNHGWYGNADLCEKCHPTCGKCEGPKSNQCLTCSDVSYDLVDGTCKRDIPCPTGLYYDDKQCKPCSAYCAECESESLCDVCIQGFQIETLEYFGQKAAFCSEICGDGRRFQLDCDDGNSKRGDGCSQTCEVEKGYTCQGGSSTKPSHCVDFIPTRTFITLKNTVHLYGRIVQGIRMSYIPSALTSNDCAKCSKLLWVRVIDAQVVPAVRVKYLPKSKYQFLVEFDFHGLFAVPVFSISTQINPEFKDYFADADIAQIKIKIIDPAVLAKSDKHKELSLDDISSGGEIDIADEDVESLFS